MPPPPVSNAEVKEASLVAVVAVVVDVQGSVSDSTHMPTSMFGSQSIFTIFVA